MKINSIQSYFYRPVFGNENTSLNNKQPQESNKKTVSKKVLGYGVAGLAAIGLATFAIIKLKKSPAKVAKDIVNETTDAAQQAAREVNEVHKPAVKSPKEEVLIPETEKELDRIASETPVVREKPVSEEPVSNNVAAVKEELTNENNQPQISQEIKSASPENKEISKTEEVKSDVEGVQNQEPVKTEGNLSDSVKKEEVPAENPPVQNTEQTQAETVKQEEINLKKDEIPVENQQTQEKAAVEAGMKNTDSEDNASDGVQAGNTAEVQPQILSEAVKSDNFTVTNIETEPFSMQSVDLTQPPFVGVEKNISVDYNNGTGRTYQRFYHKDKIYETSIYDELTDDSHDILKLTRYNYAYENGRLVGVAKQDIDKDGHHWGIYHDGRFDPFPIFVKMKGDKEFRQVPVYTPDALFELDGRFDPYNM